MPDDLGRFSVVMVCTGNICRSPAAERLAALSWGDPSTLVVSSVGVRAMVGEPISLPMAHLLESHGAYSGEFAARQVSPALLRDADLVLGMTRRHRRAVLEVFPAATRRTFTLREFARLAAASEHDLPDADGQEPLAALVSAAVQHRGPLTDPAADDIRDPYGHEADVYEEAFEAIRESVDTVAGVLRRVT
ncbi:protein tyrosine phosphatase [Intrasporangium oryzae NRRL B-24470]|uniref:Protein tyrosine phosphatase n=1 Tax=Intrasporangium oryzae NRRL B-24470 TaxID=1386089 RepID=W9G9B5_9MICO|nr:low molecular weight phosphatase family protein [Intrasporangium oryzae]EWT02786.1 protein tyrosine phosphatase [Intrasporangium oryzae NRRL B-24470]